MPTYQQRLQSIGNAVINGVATPQQLETLARAFHGLSYGGGDDPQWATYSNAEKAAYALGAIRGEFKRILRKHRTLTAERDANTAIDTEFPETP